MKKLLSTALAAVMATGSIVSANAAVVRENNSVQVLDSSVKAVAPEILMQAIPLRIQAANM